MPVVHPTNNQATKTKMRIAATAMDVAAWLRELGLDQYEAAFRANDVDAEVLPTLTVDDLKDLGIASIGHRRRMLEAIAALRSQTSPVERVAAVSPSPLVDPIG